MRRTCLQHVILLQKAHLPMTIWMPVAFFFTTARQRPFFKNTAKDPARAKDKAPKADIPHFFLSEGAGTVGAKIRSHMVSAAPLALFFFFFFFLAPCFPFGGFNFPLL